jgi:hypothetical protein
MWWPYITVKNISQVLAEVSKETDYDKYKSVSPNSHCTKSSGVDNSLQCAGSPIIFLWSGLIV